MRYFSWNSDADHFATIAGVDANESLLLSPFGREKAISRDLIHLRVILDERGALPLSDTPNTGLQQPRVLSEKAWNLLGPILAPNGVVVKSAIDRVEGRYYVWFPTLVLDCLDPNRSEVFETLSSFRRIIKPVFLRKRIPDDAIFVVKGFENQDVWVSDDFRSLVDRSDLKGIQYRMSARCV